jgi:excinuclease ABC subunit C
MQLPDKVKAKLQALPDQPGVYLMRDRAGRVIYVGKAASLKKRVGSYFRQGTVRSADPKLRGLLKSVADIDLLVVRTEAEATLTEGRLIKEYRPRYNVAFRDDKRFLLLKVNRSDPWPRLQLARIQKDDRAAYFGPYANAASARATQHFVEKRYGLRQCRPHIPGPEDHTHCMNDILRYCAAPCVAKITREGYAERVEEACAFLRGERKDVLKELEEAMRAAAGSQDFEKAAALRDTLLNLRKTIKRRILGTKDLSVKQEEARMGVLELKVALCLPSAPRVIECYDISNISGTHAVGSLVCAVDGVPNRNRYRTFRIKTVEGIDDPRMMAEVIRRRFSRARDESAPLPDLVVVDGGITQSRAARAELDALGLETLPVAGLAKRYEELIYEARGTAAPLRLPAGSNALNVLKQIRDEAHRFALTYHRKLRARRIHESMLDEIPGIGKKRKAIILRHFGSITRLRKASEAEIAEVPGIGPEMAGLIKSEFSREE